MKHDLMKEVLKKKIAKNSLLVSKDPIYDLSSGQKSRFYIDLKKVTLDPECQAIIGNIFYKIISHHNVTAVGGPESGAIPISTAVSYVSWIHGNPIKSFIIRKTHNDNTKNRIEGNLSNGERVIILDDIVTTGESIIQSLDTCNQFELSVEKIIVLVDREESN